MQATLTQYDSNSEQNVNVIELFDSIRAWRTTVNINDSRQLLVGDPGRQNNYILHPKPADGAPPVVGHITRHLETSDKSLSYVVKFTPQSPEALEYLDILPVEHELNNKQAFSDADESPEIVVTSLTVEPHDRTERLDAILPLIRNALSSPDWIRDVEDVEGDVVDEPGLKVDPDYRSQFETVPWIPIDADAAYGDWLEAANTLGDFATDSDTLEFNPNLTGMSPIMHTIARYNLSAGNAMSYVSDALVDKSTNPELFRELLFNFAEEHTSRQPVPLLAKMNDPAHEPSNNE